MEPAVKIKKRGFVMTGGGAKGFYEAGVIHAFHITGMEFDVITGSSIGAMNSLAYAEYLYRKRRLPEGRRRDPLDTMQAMEPFVRAYHRTWLMMPNSAIIDDRETGPLGQLKDDLARFDIALPPLVRLGWWYQDPERGKLPGPGLWADLVRVLTALAGRLSGGEIMAILKDHPHGLVKTALRAYLARFGMERSLVPADQDTRLSDRFTTPLQPLCARHLDEDAAQEYDAGAEAYPVIEAQRTLADYARAGIDVRLTRANYRTGRLEISSHVTPDEFVRFMEKHAWRVEVPDPVRIPLGSFRLQMPGNPNAIHAGLASGRFPAVFAPYPITGIYPEADAENALLYRLMRSWLADPDAVSTLQAAYHRVHGPQASDAAWRSLLAKWQGSDHMQGFFPVAQDYYVDGGAIDNTPSNTAVDAIREEIDACGGSRRNTRLELFLIYLEPEPRVDAEKMADPAIFDVVQRTLQIQGVAKKSADGVTVDTINTFGQRGEDLGRALQLLLTSYRAALPSLSAADQAAAAHKLAAGLAGLDLSLPEGAGMDVVLDQLAAWTGQMIDERLPLPVEKVIVYPSAMPLDTLQFTERLGYRKPNAIKMLAQGCCDTLFALRNRLEQPGNIVDEQDRRARDLARRWMGAEPWPTREAEQLAMSDKWRCTRTECLYHARYCPRGASAVTQ